MSQRHDSSLPRDSARNIAVHALLAFEQTGVRIQDGLNELFHTTAIDGRERRFATELACGVCRRRITLDHLIARASDRPLRRIDAAVLNILRLGMYQLVYLGGTADFAAVHEAVSQTNGLPMPNAGRFVNAILRAVQRDITGTISPGRDDQPQATIWLDHSSAIRFNKNVFPSPGRNLARFYSLAYGHPRWLIERWLKRYSREVVRELCLANNARPPLTLRANRLRTTAAQLGQRLTDAGFEIACCGQGVQLSGPAVPEQLPGYEEGLFSVQDPAAMSVAPLLAPQPGQRILDLCAGPGGKTTHLAELMNNKGTVVACDVSPAKLQLIDDNCRRLGTSIVQNCLVDELDKLVEDLGGLDGILVDAPCSNTGVLARRVEARHLLKPAAIKAVAALQWDLLTKAGDLLKDNALLLYSTCSIEPTENELLIRCFLQHNCGFRLQEQQFWLPQAPGQAPIAEDTSELGEQFSGGRCGHDGGYTALLSRG